jgi:hypothetical protein
MEENERVQGKLPSGLTTCEKSDLEKKKGRVRMETRRRSMEKRN